MFISVTVPDDIFKYWVSSHSCSPSPAPLHEPPLAEVLRRPATEHFARPRVRLRDAKTLQRYLRPSSVASIALLLVSSLTVFPFISFDSLSVFFLNLYILIGTFAFPSLPTLNPPPSLPPPPLVSVGCQLGLCGACAVAVGGLLGQRRAIRLPLLSGGGGGGWGGRAGLRSLRAGGAHEEPQGAPADEREPVELRGHEQRGAQVTVPGHGQRDQVEGDGRVPGSIRGRQSTCQHMAWAS